MTILPRQLISLVKKALYELALIYINLLETECSELALILPPKISSRALSKTVVILIMT